MANHPMIEIRKEKPEDREAIYKLNMAAFDNGPEAALVDKLRATCEDYCSFVAIEHGTVVGHILFTPVTVDGSPEVGMGLAPMSVLPSHQNKGIGSQLVNHGIEQVRSAGHPFVIVLGHPEYYPRFGFEPASEHKFVSQWEGVPDEVFMIIVFDEAAIPGTGGVLRYLGAFDDAM